jgi:hypothetical protein
MIVPSVSHAALTPAELTPFHVLDVVVLTLEIRRHGFALEALVRMMVGALLLTPRWARGWSLMSASLCTSPCRPDYIFIPLCAVWNCSARSASARRVAGFSSTMPSARLHR